MENDRPLILVVDDDDAIARAISISLEREGYNTSIASDGVEALDNLEQQEVKLIIMDIMMPNLDGISALLKLRESKNIPVILLSAKSEDTDKINGLSMGADDYITKPFNPHELIARVRAHLRRYIHFGGADSTPKTGTITSGGLQLDTVTRQAFVDGEPIHLTATELSIVELLLSNAGRVYPAEEIYERIWNEPAYSVENTIMVHIRRIREKIETVPSEPKYLKVVWGQGYKIEKIPQK